MLHPIDLQVNCEVDRAGLGSLTFNAIEFSCPVDQDKEVNIQVGVGFLQGFTCVLFLICQSVCQFVNFCCVHYRPSPAV